MLLIIYGNFKMVKWQNKKYLYTLIMGWGWSVKKSQFCFFLHILINSYKAPRMATCNLSQCTSRLSVMSTWLGIDDCGKLYLYILYQPLIRSMPIYIAVPPMMTTCCQSQKQLCGWCPHESHWGPYLFYLPFTFLIWVWLCRHLGVEPLSRPHTHRTGLLTKVSLRTYCAACCDLDYCAPVGHREYFSF
jgi:hypothetical protein